MSGCRQDLRSDCRLVQSHDEGKVIAMAEFFEAEMPVKALGTFVCGTDAKMDRGYAMARELVEHGLDHEPSPSTRLGFGQNIDVKMRGIGLFKARRAAVRIGYSLENIGVFFGAGYQTGDLAADKRPPISAECFVKAGGIRRADNIADDPIVFGKNEGELWSEFEIGHRPYITGKARIAVKCARVGSGVSRHQANVKEGVNVVLGGRADEIIVDLRRHRTIDLLAAARRGLTSGSGKTGKVEELHLRDESPLIF